MRTEAVKMGLWRNGVNIHADLAGHAVAVSVRSMLLGFMDFMEVQSLDRDGLDSLYEVE